MIILIAVMKMSDKQNLVKKGDVLLAEPFMIDPNFKRAAVLLCEHQDDGSIGFIMNKPLDVKISDLVQDFPEFESKVFFGGPVSTDTVHFIHNSGDILDNSVQIENGVFWGGDFEKLKVLIQSQLIKPEDIRFYVGYSGWSSGQLYEELNIGSWVIAEMHANYLFKVEPNALWKLIMSNKGDAYSVIAQMPDSANWN
jgi:putative transcriptional regulator